MGKFKFDYSENSDILHIHKNEKTTKGSVELGCFTLDFGENKEIVGLEIEHASEFLNKSGINKKSLKSIQYIKFIINKKNPKERLISLNIKFPNSIRKIDVPLEVA
ncbi:DUF2283 domain-containing protein [Candidatus Woesearchaeota archaeon]|nr:DUF2283 domain-containing protein [Candidatus Woesearchaeota archaeon]